MSGASGLVMASAAPHMVEDETDGGVTGMRSARTCIATRTVRPAAELLRFVIGPDGAVVPDLKAVLPGRGVWVTATRAALDQAVARRAFPRAFKGPVAVEPGLGDRVDRLLADRAREALALANKAGEVVVGFTKVEAALSRASALIHAVEAGSDGVEKLNRAYRGLVAERAIILSVFAGVEMDLAMGRSNVVHAALVHGPAAEACLRRIRALVRFRTGTVGDGADRNAAEGGRKPPVRTDRE